MPRVCTVCSHPQRGAIDHALVARASYPSLVAAYSVSSFALCRHKDRHLPKALVEAQDSATAADADDLLRQVRAMQTRTLAILDKAEAAGRLGTAVMAIREARGNLELLAKLLGELDERPTFNLVVSPAWLELRAHILVALAPYPEARASVAEALGNAG